MNARIVMSIGVSPEESMDKLEVKQHAIVVIDGKTVLLPVFSPSSGGFIGLRGLEEQRKEAHRLIDECVDVFAKHFEEDAV